MQKNNTYNNKMKLLYSIDKNNPVLTNNYDVIGNHTTEFKNELIVFHHTEKGLYTYKSLVTNIQVTKGELTFFLENGQQITYENSNLVHDVCTDGEPPSPNKYASFWGKKSILEHHSSEICHIATCYGAVGDKSSLYFLSEVLYDEGTYFFLEDFHECVEALNMFNTSILETLKI